MRARANEFEWAASELRCVNTNNIDTNDITRQAHLIRIAQEAKLMAERGDIVRKQRVRLPLS